MVSQNTALIFKFVTTLSLFLIPLIAMNIAMAKRKGKNQLLVGLLSVIPLLTVTITIYLASMTDYVVIQKIDNLKKLVKKNNSLDE